ncbi:relaxase [Halalkalicoccus sp. NIPERK01]|uniref:relaxase/mobilization nuclease domain-containing protein n=1 Tax=Halalkalicoccus sp. NIPERK01 TaxID=3053469 RepID=UPI00256F5F00|nr:relaxase [Halalkalicoccus sp. NIPERK01]MDL5363897.1 relaxase [Halalkalicoccus sp. NIPERK01]
MFGDDRDTIYKTSYRDEEGTEKLTNYLQHDDQAVRDRTGRAMTDKEIEQFNDKAAGKRNRHIIISPRDHADLTDRELDRATREYMSEMIEERPTADYVYAIHDDKESGKDVHIAMTANDKSDLEMYPDDIKRERKHAHESYLEFGRDRTRTHENEQQNERAHESGRVR